MEYTQVGPAVFLLSIYAWHRSRKNHDIFAESKVLSLCKKIWRKWHGLLLHKPINTLLLAWLLISLIWFIASLSKHRGFHSAAADLGIFVNVLHNILTSGAALASLKDGISFFADHQIFLLYPIAGFYALFPGAGILLLLQAIALSSGALALFFLGRQRLGKEHLLLPLLPLCYWAYAPIRAANLFDFHPETLMLPLFLFSVLGIQSKKMWPRILGVFLFIAALSAKESAGPVAVGLGLAWLWMGKDRAMRFFGCLAIVLGLVCFWFDTQYFPKLIGAKYAYSNVYDPFGSSLLEIASAPFRYPIEFFERIFGLSRVKFLFGLLAPLLFLPLLAPRALIAAAPGIFMLFLTAGSQRVSLGFHYAIEPAIGLFFALPFALESAFAKKHSKKILYLLPLSALIFFGRSEIYHWRFHAPTSSQIKVRDQILPLAEENISLSASSALVPHLAARKWVHQLPNLHMPAGAKVDCVFWDSSVNNTPMNAQDMENLAALLREEYLEEFSCESLRVYRRKDFQSSCFETKPTCAI
jgi:uncharacterized membrane protein